MTADPLLDVGQAASFLGVKRGFVYRRAAQLGAVKVGSCLRFTQEGLSAYVARQRVTEPAEQAPTPIGPSWLPRKLRSGPVGKVTGHVYATPPRAERLEGGR